MKCSLYADVLLKLLVTTVSSGTRATSVLPFRHVSMVVPVGLMSLPQLPMHTAYVQLVGGSFSSVNLLRPALSSQLRMLPKTVSVNVNVK